MRDISRMNKSEFGGDNVPYILDGKMLANEMMDNLSVRADNGAYVYEAIAEYLIMKGVRLKEGAD